MRKSAASSSRSRQFRRNRYHALQHGSPSSAPTRPWRRNQPVLVCRAYRPGRRRKVVATSGTASVSPHPPMPDAVIQSAAARRGRRYVYDTLDPARTALVVIDLQRAFIDEGAPSEVPQARAIVPNVNRVASGVRAAGGTVAWVQGALGAKGWPMFFDHIVSPERWAAILAALQSGAELHALHPGLEVKEGDLVLPKYRLSAFLPGASPLPLVLRDRGIDTVLIAGCM